MCGRWIFGHGLLNHFNQGMKIFTAGLLTAVLSLTLFLIVPSCQSNAGMIAEDTLAGAHSALSAVHTERMIEVQEVEAAVLAGEMTWQEGFAATIGIAKAGLNSGLEAGKAELAVGWEAVKAEARAVPARVPGALADSLGLYLGGGGLLGSLVVLVERLFFTRRREERNNQLVKAEINNDRNAKYVPQASAIPAGFKLVPDTGAAA